MAYKRQSNLNTRVVQLKSGTKTDWLLFLNANVNERFGIDVSQSHAEHDEHMRVIQCLWTNLCWFAVVVVASRSHIR